MHNFFTSLYSYFRLRNLHFFIVILFQNKNLTSIKFKNFSKKIKESFELSFIHLCLFL
uniref:Uncharacterized protein n=1 Tax=Siphoviridae sp. ctHip2 TaxID=2827830 RepID=A0A8S5RV79_9CAUD|nr:MAG TPA: hypothetical protein [Siphoviridae sp. ctHip2]